MKKLVLLLFLLTSVLLPVEGNDDFGTWTLIQLNFNKNNFYSFVRAEYRSKDNMKAMDCWYIQPRVGYKFTSWLKTDVGYYFYKKPGSIEHRPYVSVTGTLKRENLSVSLREKYVYEYNATEKTSENVLRSQLKAQYAIPKSIFSPYVAVEVFTWKKWQKTRHYVGTQLNVSRNVSFDLYYMYYSFDGKPSEHVLGAGLIFDLN